MDAESRKLAVELLTAAMILTASIIPIARSVWRSIKTKRQKEELAAIICRIIPVAINLFAFIAAALFDAVVFAILVSGAVFVFLLWRFGRAPTSPTRDEIIDLFNALIIFVLLFSGGFIVMLVHALAGHAEVSH